MLREKNLTMRTWTKARSTQCNPAVVAEDNKGQQESWKRWTTSGIGYAPQVSNKKEVSGNKSLTISCAVLLFLLTPPDCHSVQLLGFERDNNADST